LSEGLKYCGAIGQEYAIQPTATSNSRREYINPAWFV